MMAKSHMWQVGVLVFAFVVCSKCSMLCRNLECPLSGASFGGRLVFMDGGGLESSLFPSLAHRGRKIILQTPPAHLRSPMAYGRGKIWIGSRSCKGPVSQTEQCPWTGDRPCLDKGIPCETEPTCYSQSHPLEFSEVTKDSITVTWPDWDEKSDYGVGPVTGYKILYRPQGEIFQEILLDGNRLSHRFDDLIGGTVYQFRIVLVREGEPPECTPSKIQNVTTLCGELKEVNLDLIPRLVDRTGNFRINVTWQLPTLTGDCVTEQRITIHQLDLDGCNTTQEDPEEEKIEIGTTTKTYRRFPPNTRYNITLLIRYPGGTFSTSRDIRTPGTVPGTLNGLQKRPREDRIWFLWSDLPCGKRNGQIQRYEHVATINGRDATQPRNGELSKRYKLHPLSIGDKWKFKVRACNEKGCGAYAVDEGVMD